MRRTEQIIEALNGKKLWFHIYNSGEDGLEIAFVINDRMYCTVASWGMGWDHVSVHIEVLNGPETYKIMPMWDDMCILKDIFFHDNEWAMQLHPPATKNISTHNEVLHLWRPQRKGIPKPPRILV